MNRDCKHRTRCKHCYLELCPFGRDGEPSEDEYPTAKDRRRRYEPQEA